MVGTSFEPGLDYAQYLDSIDELARFRAGFVTDEPELIYLDGNSLGRLPKRTLERMREVVEVEWGQDLVRGWNAGWYRAPRRIGDKIAQLVGAGPGQIVISDSTSVCLFKLATAALEMQLRRAPGRNRIVSDVLNFPSDLYVLQGCVRMLGGQHVLDLVPSVDGILVDQSVLMDAIDEQTALVTLSHVAFKSGFMHDVAAVTSHAHRMGSLVLWDLSHSVGAVPIELNRWGVDLAVGCTYKYLNGGPGAPAFLHVRPDLQEDLLSPIWGWFGQQAPFDFEIEYQPSKDIGRFLAGTPPVLSMLAMDAALEVCLEAGIERIRHKSVQLTSYLVYLVDEVLVPLGFTLGSPRDPALRGSHISVRHPAGYQLSRALIEDMQVLPDFREPDHIRLGLAPLYTSFVEVWKAVDRTRRVVQAGTHLRHPSERLVVT
jgi:kynureninase